MKRLIAITALSGMMLVPAATTAMAQEASPPTTSELDENLPGDAPDVLEDNGDDDSNAGLWGLLGLLGLVGLAGLTALKKRRDDTYSTSTTTTTRPAPPTSRGATGTDK